MIDGKPPCNIGNPNDNLSEEEDSLFMKIVIKDITLKRPRHTYTLFSYTFTSSLLCSPFPHPNLIHFPDIPKNFKTLYRTELFVTAL